MTNTKGYVDSLYVSRSTGDKITIRTVNRGGRDSYIVFNGGWRVTEYKRSSSVRKYIMDNDCQPVETH